MRYRTFLASGLLCLLTASVSFAGPPFRTDDPIPVPYKHGELYLFTTGVIDGTGESGVGPAVEFNYGVLPNTQFHIVFPISFDAPKGGTSYAGYGDTEVGVKYRFVEQSKYIADVGLFPLVEIPTGNAAKGLGSGTTQVYVPLWLQKDIGNWTLYGGDGYWYNPGPGNKNWDFSGILVQYNFSDVLFLGAEIFHQTPSSADLPGYTGIHIGGSVPVAKNYEILFSGDAGNGITSYKHFGYYLGLYHTF